MEATEKGSRPPPKQLGMPSVPVALLEGRGLNGGVDGGGGSGSILELEGASEVGGRGDGRVDGPAVEGVHVCELGVAAVGGEEFVEEGEGSIVIVGVVNIHSEGRGGQDGGLE